MLYKFKYVLLALLATLVLIKAYKLYMAYTCDGYGCMKASTMPDLG